MIRTRPGVLATLGLVAAGLCGAMVWEFRAFLPLDDRPAERMALQAAPLPDGTQPASLVDGWMREILARPIFSPDRRPVEVSGRQAGGLRLTGIIVSDLRRVAIFVKPSGARATIVEEGSVIDGAKVLEVTQTGVILLGPNGRTVMTPIYDPAPRQRTPPPVPISTPR